MSLLYCWSWKHESMSQFMILVFLKRNMMNHFIM